MTGSEMREALAELGWKQADLCRRLDKDKNTVSKWAANDPPTWVAEYLGLSLEVDRLHRRFIRPPKTAKNISGEDGAAPNRGGRAERMAKQLQLNVGTEGASE